MIEDIQLPDDQQTGGGSMSHDNRDILHYLQTSKDHASTAVTTLAAVFNILAILVICFVLMPSVNQVGIEVQKNTNEVRESHKLLEEERRFSKEIHQDIQRFSKTIDRLNDALDAAEAKARAWDKALKDKAAKAKEGKP